MINKHQNEKRILSLFSGCGGMDIGMEGGFWCFSRSVNHKLNPDFIEKCSDPFVYLKPTGFKIVFANDIRPDAKIAWVNYFQKRYKNAHEIFRLESIVDLVKKERLGKKIFPRDIDIITGGFPCQDFSVAGKRLGMNSKISHNGKSETFDKTENRGMLYMWMKEVVSIVKPKMFIAENVKGLVSLEDAKTIIEKDFASASKNGYLVLPAKVIQAVNFGVPQSRERIIFFGFRRDALKEKAIHELEKKKIVTDYDPYPTPTHSFSIDLENDKIPFVKVREALFDLAEPNQTNDLSQVSFSRAKYIPKSQGNIEINLESVSPTIRSEHHGNIEFRRLNVENGGKYIDELNKGFIQRRLTVRECARIQTFPDDYEFVIKNLLSASNSYKLIGNAVPCVLAYNIAQNIKKKWDLYFK